MRGEDGLAIPRAFCERAALQEYLYSWRLPDCKSGIRPKEARDSDEAMWRNISKKRVFEIVEARTSHISIACDGLTTTANYAASPFENSKIEMLALWERGVSVNCAGKRC